MIRDGKSPKMVAADLGISQRAIQNRFDRAGRLDEYRNVVMDAEAKAVARVDADALMECADKGLSLNSACIELGYPRATAIRRLEDERRMGEFYIRTYAARNHTPIPVVDSEVYREGPRRAIVSAIARAPTEDVAESLKEALMSIDRMVSDGAKLSAMCGGNRP